MLAYVLLVVALGAWLLQYKRRQWAVMKLTESIPGLKCWPITGHAHLFMNIRSLYDFQRKVYAYTDKHAEAGVMKFWFGNFLIITVWDPEYLEIIANSPAAAGKGNFYKLFMGDLPDGVAMSEGGARWRELRRPLGRSFSRRLVDNDFHSVFVRRTRQFLDILDQKTGTIYNIETDVGALMLDIFGETHLGLQIDEVNTGTWNFAHHINRYLITMFTVVIKYHFYFWRLVYKFTKLGKVLDENISNVNSFLQWVFEERKKSTNYRKDGVEYYPDFLLRRGREKNIPETKLRKELIDVVAAGVDTSATLFNCLLVFLAMFPEVQEQVYQEQLELLGDRDPTVEDLASMDYLEMVIKETLRHVSPAAVHKYCTEDIHIGKHTIPAGSVAFLYLQRNNHNAKFFERPLEFYPEHFLPEREATRPRYAFNPFGVGPRSCPASQYGIQQVKVIASLIVRRYKISTNKKFEDIEYEHGLLHVMREYPVSFQRR